MSKISGTAPTESRADGWQSQRYHPGAPYAQIWWPSLFKYVQEAMVAMRWDGHYVVTFAGLYATDTSHDIGPFKEFDAAAAYAAVRQKL